MTNHELPFDQEVDIIIVGFGGAGSAAAITARRAGAAVIVMEKQGAHRHTPSTRMSGGLVMGVNDPTLAANYLHQCAGGMIPPELSAAWAQRALGLIDWLHGLDPGLRLSRIGGAEHPEMPGSAGIDVYQPGGALQRLDPNGKAGTFLFEAIARAVIACGAQVLWETSAHRLIRSASGQSVIGVEAQGANGRLRIRARRGVILSCGGFLHDESMKRNFLRAYPMYFYGNPGNTGDGVRMAQEVGADLWHMNQMIGRAIGNFRMEDGTDLSFIIFINPPGYVITDRYGQRFADESSQANLLHGFYYSLLEYDPDTGIYPRNPCYWFFDETRRKAGPLTLPFVGATAVGLYDWSADNSREIERGWIFRGNSIAEAAAAAGIDSPAAAQASVDAYNQSCANGTADPLGRPASTMVPIQSGPFYCVKLYPGGSNTTGGPRRNQQAQVLNTYGEPIEGLYAAGELGQATGMQYPADGSNLSEAFCFGQIAAESALGLSRPEQGAC
jgi:succinate dehydrogenase/fumarate reductase flavoprotein subunit